MSALPSIQKKSWRQRVEEEDERLRVELKQEEQQQLPAIAKEAKKKKAEVEYPLPDAANDEITTANLLKVLNFWHACERGEASYKELAKWFHEPRSAEWFKPVTDSRNFRYTLLDENKNPFNPLRDDIYGKGKPSPYENLEFAILALGQELKKEAERKRLESIHKQFARPMTQSEKDAFYKKAADQRERLAYLKDKDKEDQPRAMTEQERYPRVLRRALLYRRGIDMSNPDPKKKKHTSGHADFEEEEDDGQQQQPEAEDDDNETY